MVECERYELEEVDKIAVNEVDWCVEGDVRQRGMFSATLLKHCLFDGWRQRRGLITIRAKRSNTKALGRGASWGDHRVILIDEDAREELKGTRKKLLICSHYYLRDERSHDLVKGLYRSVRLQCSHLDSDTYYVH